MSRSTEQRLAGLRALVWSLDGEAAGLRLAARENPTVYFRRRVEIAERRSEAEKEIARLTVGRLRTA